MFSLNTVWDNVDKVRGSGPVVHSITNYVVMNSTANESGDKYKEARALHRKIIAEVGNSRSPVASKSTAKKKLSRSASSKVRKPSRASRKVALKGIRFTSSNDYTRVVIDLSGETKHQYKFLNADPSRNLPFRLYIDLDKTVPTQSVKDELKIYDGILRMIRVGKPVPSTSRVVLDFEAVRSSFY